MKKYFRLYTDGKTGLSSSIFDLMSGDKEPIQTKGLAYLLCQDEKFIYKFLEFGPIRQAVNETLKSNINFKRIT